MQATDRTGMVEALQGMLDELCSPDLTLERSKVLRPRLFELLGRLDQSTPGTSESAPAGAKAKEGAARGVVQERVRTRFHGEFPMFASIFHRPCLG
jgi:hypothetical protein